MIQPARHAASDGFAVDSPAIVPPPRTLQVLFVGLALAAFVPLAVAVGTGDRARPPVEAWRGPLELFEPEAARVPEAVERVTRVSLMAADDLYALFVGRGYLLEDTKTANDPVPRMVVERLPRDLAALESPDLRTGSRGFTIWNRNGTVEWDSGAFLEHLAISLGHYPELRSGNRGNEPEGVEVATFGTERA
jgi:hypothetical protein